MVLRKSKYYGFDGFQVPSFPRAPRSARGRGLHRQKIEDNRICAIELLASLAGKLLQGSESSSACSNASEADDQPAVGNDVIKQEPDEDNIPKSEHFDQRSCEESVYIPGLPSQNSNKKCVLKESPSAAGDFRLNPSLIVTKSDSSERVCHDVKSIVERGSPDLGVGHVETAFSRQKGADGLGTPGSTNNSTCSSKDPLELCIKFPAVNNPDNNISTSSCRDHIRHENHPTLGSGDNGEKFSSCNKLMAPKPMSFRPPSHIGDRRIRKLLTSKYWKKAPKLKDCELPRAALDRGIKPLYHKRKFSYNHKRYQHEPLYKRRRFPDCSLIVTSDGGFSSESVCNSPENGTNGEKNGSVAMFDGGILAFYATYVTP
uniref:Uncharacterized protein n=1 Tax=Rhizophora mucronata TaxID=61149 RepID=A0A2P2JCU9_RHIMU